MTEAIRESDYVINTQAGVYGGQIVYGSFSIQKDQISNREIFEGKLKIPHSKTKLYSKII